MIDAFSMLASVILGLFLGINIDKIFNTKPLFTLLFTFLGIGVSIYSVLKRK